MLAIEKFRDLTLFHIHFYHFAVYHILPGICIKLFIRIKAVPVNLPGSVALAFEDRKVFSLEKH